jgi:hypothetical protein
LLLRALTCLRPASPSAQSRGFLGTAWQGTPAFAARVHNIGPYLRTPVTELMCHPGYADDELRGVDGFTLHRERELEALCRSGLRGEWQRSGIRLVNFGDLRPRRDRKSPELDQDNDPHHEARDRADAIR